MHYKTIKWNKYSLYLSVIHVFFFIQTLTKLYLGDNQFGTRGRELLEKLKTKNPDLEIYDWDSLAKFWLKMLLKW
jgi:hypothetical protein